MTEYVTVTSDAPLGRNGAIKLHGREAFAGMHKAGRLAAETLDMLVPHMVPGVTTAEIDRLIYDFVLAGGGMQDRHLTYVQASRARGETRLFIDRLEAGVAERLAKAPEPMRIPLASLVLAKRESR